MKTFSSLHVEFVFDNLIIPFIIKDLDGAGGEGNPDVLQAGVVVGHGVIRW